MTSSSQPIERSSQTEEYAHARNDRTDRRPVIGAGPAGRRLWAGRDERRRRPARRAASVAPRRVGAGDPPRSTAPATPLPVTGSQAEPGDVVDPLVLLPGHRRRARAGRGRAQGGRGLQRHAPGHPPAVRGRHLRRAPATRWRPSSRPATAPTSSDRSASAAPRRSTASGSTCSRSSTRPAST